MFNRKFVLMAVFLVSLLAISAVSASEDVDNDIVTSDDSMLQSTEILDSAIESTDDESILDDKDDDVLKSTDDHVQSFVDEDAWFNDKIIWYDGDWDNVQFGSFDYVDNLENPKNITIKLSCDDNPVANVDLAFLNDYDNKIAKLTTDSNGIAVYNIPFNVNEFSFCVSFWHDENHMISCVDIGPNMIYSFDLNTWNNTNCDENTVYNNHSHVSNDTPVSNDTQVIHDTNNNGTFTELQNLIDGVPSGSIIYLENDYKIDNEFMWHGSSVYWDGLKISKSLIIDGNGHSLNGGGEVGTSRILTITNDVSVTLRNIIFTHGARAITAVSNLNIINCTFTNNALMDSDGGAVYCSGKLMVKDSNFTGNSAVYIGSDYTLRGGAIICGKDSTVSNSTFDGNAANRGSAVSGFHSGDVTLTDCTFYENTGLRNGVFYHVNIIVNNGNVVNCRFVGYKSSDNVVDGDVINCVFTKDSILTVDDVTKFYGGSDMLQINLVDSLGNGIVNADVNVVIDDGDILTVKTDSNGHASLDLNLAIGDHDVFSSYNGVSEVSKVSVLSTITAVDVAGVYSNSKVSATFLNTDGKALASRQVNFKINGKDYLATTNGNGVATANVDLGVGSYKVTAVNPVNNEQKQFNLVISKAKSNIALTSSQSNGAVTLTASLTPATATGSVSFNVNGVNKNVAIKNGNAMLILTELQSGGYSVTAMYDGDNNLDASTSNTVNFNVADAYPILTAKDLTKTYGDSKKLVVNLVDSKGNAIPNAMVKVNINNKITTITTNGNGQATMAISLTPDKYTATVTYGEVKTTVKVTVKKATPKLTAKAKTFKKADKTKKYTVTLKNYNKVISGSTVKITVNKKTYTTKTTKGVATFKLTKLTKKGKYTATVKYAGSKYFNAKSVKVKITVK